MKVSISLLTFLEFHHLCKAKLVPFISEMSNIRIKIELLLAAFYAIFLSGSNLKETSAQL